MAITTFNPIFHVNDTEYGYNIDEFCPCDGGKTIRMYIPKIMGHTSTGKVTVRANNMFSNDVKPTFSKNVNRIDYVTVNRKDTGSRTNILNIDDLIEKNHKFIVEFVNGNIASRYCSY